MVVNVFAKQDFATVVVVRNFISKHPEVGIGKKLIGLICNPFAFMGVVVSNLTKKEKIYLSS